MKRKAAPATITQAGKKREFERIRKRVFKYPESDADERYFKIWIHQWLCMDIKTRPTWTQALFSMVYKRNNNGEALKYCYFNDYHQRFFLTIDFKKWADATKHEIVEILKKHYV